MVFKKNISIRNKAQAMAEFAIALPLLLLLLYGIVETGRYLFLYSTVVTASRQAARYGSATGENLNGVKRYQDCDGMRNAANSAGFLGNFDSIQIEWDEGPQDTTPTIYCTASTDTTLTENMVGDNAHRIVVTVRKRFTPLVRLVPFSINDIEATSSRTILSSVSIVVTVPPQLVVQDPTETVITSDSPDPSGLGQQVTVTVHVTNQNDPSTIPTGTVDVDGGEAGVSCQITLDNTGTGSCVITYTTTGAKNITAIYNGDDQNLPSSDDLEPHTVGPAVTTTTITADTPDPSEANPQVNVNVGVTVTSTWGTPTGTVTISGADTNCTITLSGGIGNCNVTFTSAGTRTLTATYNGNTNFAPSSDTETHDVLDTRQTITRITGDSPDPSLVGQNVTVSVTVVGVTTPTGVVNITGADTNCQITLNGNGTGSCIVVFNSLGARTLTASYAGDTNHDPSSDTESHTVSLPPTVTTITSDLPEPSITNQPVNVTVTVTGGTPVPTGTVTISGADTNCTITLVNGTGACNVTFTTSGTKTLTATYSGDSAYLPSSDTESHSVTAEPVQGCDQVTRGLLTKSGNTMSMTINNPLSANLQIQDVTVQWNNDKGHQTTNDKTLRLQTASIGGVTFFTGNNIGPSLIIVPSPTAFIAANGQSTITFTFHQSYDNWDNTEYISITLANPGCEQITISQNQHQ